MNCAGITLKVRVYMHFRWLLRASGFVRHHRRSRIPAETGWIISRYICVKETVHSPMKMFSWFTGCSDHVFRAIFKLEMHEILVLVIHWYLRVCFMINQPNWVFNCDCSFHIFFTFRLLLPSFNASIKFSFFSFSSDQMLRIFRDTYRNVDTAEYSCSAGGFQWIVISCAEHLHAWIWWICVCLNFQRPPVLVYRNPSPISAPRESFNTTPKDSTLWISPVISFYVPQQNRVSIIASLSLGTSESGWYRRGGKQWSVIVVLCFWQSLTLKWMTPV